MEFGGLSGIEGKTGVSAQHDHGVSKVLVHVDLVSKMQHDVDFATRFLNQVTNGVPQVFFIFFQTLRAVARNSNEV